MSGHSKWATTHRKKEATDAKKGAVFTKLANLISLAAKGGGDLENNFQLRLAVEKARAANMPKNNIERAIKRGGHDLTGANALEEVAYEIIGPAGSVFIAEAITDNKNRLVANLKAVLNKNNGQLGSPNSVLWLFNKKGMITINLEPPNDKISDELELKIIDAGAEDIEKNEGEWEIYTQAENRQKVEQKLKPLGLNIKESGLTYMAKNDLKINNPEAREKIEKLYLALDELDDINNVYTNAHW